MILWCSSILSPSLREIQCRFEASEVPRDISLTSERMLDRIRSERDTRLDEEVRVQHLLLWVAASRFEDRSSISSEATKILINGNFHVSSVLEGARTKMQSKCQIHILFFAIIMMTILSPLWRFSAVRLSLDGSAIRQPDQHHLCYNITLLSIRHLFS